MKSCIAFTKKEFLELIRSYKLFILVMVFLALGFLNPITAKYLPELVSSFMPEGMSIQISDPTVLDSWTQFFKNVPQLGFIILIIISSSTLAMEFQRGTLVNMITKGLSRTTIIFSKFFAYLTLWSICYSIAFLISYGYNFLFWDSNVANLLPAILFAWVFGVVLLIFVLLGVVLTKSASGGLLLCAGFFLLSLIVSFFPEIAKFSPLKLVNDNMLLLNQTISLSSFHLSLLCSIVIFIVAFFTTIIVFRKKQL